MSVCLMFSINLFFCFFLFLSLPGNHPTHPKKLHATGYLCSDGQGVAPHYARHNFFYRVRRYELKATPDSGLDITYTCYPTYWNTSCHAIPAKTVILHGDSLRRMKQGLTESYIFEQFSKLLPSGYCV